MGWVTYELCDGALALLDEHTATFPRSNLEPERSAERVFALCRAGRIEDARSARGAFLNPHPTGPLAVRVKAVCWRGLTEGRGQTRNR